MAYLQYERVLKPTNVKSIVFALALILAIPLKAQQESRNAHAFVRVFDLHGKKVAKGEIQSLSDSTLQIIHKKKSREFSLKEVGTIKTKRSAGNSILGTFIGAAFGAVVEIFFPPETFDINGEPEKWQAFKFWALVY